MPTSSGAGRPRRAVLVRWRLCRTAAGRARSRQSLSGNSGRDLAGRGRILAGPARSPASADPALDARLVDAHPLRPRPTTIPACPTATCGRARDRRKTCTASATSSPSSRRSPARASRSRSGRPASRRPPCSPARRRRTSPAPLERPPAAASPCLPDRQARRAPGRLPAGAANRTSARRAPRAGPIHPAAPAIALRRAEARPLLTAG